MSTLTYRHAVCAGLIAALAFLGLPVQAHSRQTAIIRNARPAREVRANGIKLTYESFGPRSRETILLIQGTGAQMTDWPVALCEELVRRGYRVIRYDNRDVGLSTHLRAAGAPNWAGIDRALKAGKPAPLAYTLADMAKDAVGLLDALGIRRAHIVGASMGGMIAQMVATGYPARTLSLTSIMAGDGRPGLPIVAKPEVLAKVPPPPPEGDRGAFVTFKVRTLQALASPGYPTDERTLRARVLRDMRRSYDPVGEARQEAASLVAALQDRRAALRIVRAPTVVLHGADDPLVPVAAGRDVAANIRGADLRVIPGMGHECPDALVPQFADAITAAAARARASEAGSRRTSSPKPRAH